MNPRKKIELWIEENDHRLHLWSGIGHLVKGFIGLIVFIWGADYLVKEYVPNYPAILKTHSWVFSAGVVWLVITLTLLYAVYSGRKYKNLLHRLGATCAENMKAEDYTYSERRKIIKKYSPEFHRSKKLLILGATGYHTFAKPRDKREDVDNSALLRPILERLSNDKTTSKEIDIDILLLHPKSKHAAERVKNLTPSQSLDEYKEEIIKSLRECQMFKKELPKLRCFVYDRPLIWKLMITDEFVWQQFYKDGTHAEHSRINIFSNISESGNALYHPFLKLFELLRDSAASEVDLSLTDLKIPELSA